MTGLLRVGGVETNDDCQDEYGNGRELRGWWLLLFADEGCLRVVCSLCAVVEAVLAHEQCSCCMKSKYE